MLLNPLLGRSSVSLFLLATPQMCYSWNFILFQLICRDTYNLCSTSVSSPQSLRVAYQGTSLLCISKYLYHDSSDLDYAQISIGMIQQGTVLAI
ncbi:hypothetical protein BO86DRAFT_387628 [Aspergillus japonicus CBS 114.51]|uniref:Secreted protein n=1 Tax=Aspergillus japonicus CBS 114.51 TaxID=1448312 RepID=A0A8T8X7C5_ASPJA|nr:hypothetical protein BO86DRAFT_387628 [Aspergillus japonicus CBS 114.51]RAH83784.1 hypothetical protein BO86DRAFT_387628 [Aspergillus japonicus CBS 114.51]